MLGLLFNMRRKKDFMENFYDILLYQEGVDGARGPLTSFSHFTNYLKYIFYFILGQSVLCTTFQLTGTVRATFQLTYISAYWDSPNLCFQGAKSTPKRGFKSTPNWGP